MSHIFEQFCAPLKRRPSAVQGQQGLSLRHWWRSLSLIAIRQNAIYVYLIDCVFTFHFLNLWNNLLLYDLRILQKFETIGLLSKVGGFV